MDIENLVQQSASDAGLEIGDTDDSYDTSDVVDTDEGSATDDTGSDEGATEASDTDDTGSAEAGTEETTEAKADTKTEESEAADEEAELAAIAAELTTKNPSLKRGKMPVDRHQAVLTRERRRHEAAIEELKRGYAEYDSPEFQHKKAALDLAETNPREFLTRIQQIPQLRDALEEYVRSAVATKQAPVASATETKLPDEKDDPEPEPDAMYSDGTLGYSGKQQRLRDEWLERKLLRKIQSQGNAELESFRKELEPITQARRAQERRAELEQQIAPVVDLAQNWPGFEEHLDDIHKEVMSNKYFGLPAHKALKQAYDAVVKPKLALAEKQREAALRQKLLDELDSKTRSKQTQVAPGGAATQSSNEPRSIFDIVRDAARQHAS